MIGNLHSLCLWCGVLLCGLWVGKRKRGAGCLYFESESFEKETLCEKFGFLVCSQTRLLNPKTTGSSVYCILNEKDWFFFTGNLKIWLGSLGWEERVRFFFYCYFFPSFFSKRKREEKNDERGNEWTFCLNCHESYLGCHSCQIFLFPFMSYEKKYTRDENF